MAEQAVAIAGVKVRQVMEIRIEWNIPGHGSGAGEWHLAKEHGDVIEATRAEMVAKYGKGTHWLAWRPAPSFNAEPSRPRAERNEGAAV